MLITSTTEHLSVSVLRYLFSITSSRRDYMKYRHRAMGMLLIFCLGFLFVCLWKAVDFLLLFEAAYFMGNTWEWELCIDCRKSCVHQRHSKEVIFDILSHINILSHLMLLVPCTHGRECPDDKYHGPVDHESSEEQGCLDGLSRWAFLTAGVWCTGFSSVFKASCLCIAMKIVSQICF